MALINRNLNNIFIKEPAHIPARGTLKRLIAIKIHRVNLCGAIWYHWKGHTSGYLINIFSDFSNALNKVFS